MAPRFLTGGGYLFGGPGEARLWKTATREPIGPPMTYDGPIYAVAFNPDGRTFVTAGRNKLAQLYDVETLKVVRTFRHPVNVLCAAFTPDGKMLLTGDDEGFARLWSVATGDLIGEPISAFSSPDNVAVAEDEEAIARAGLVGKGARPRLRVGKSCWAWRSAPMAPRSLPAAALRRAGKRGYGRPRREGPPAELSLIRSWSGPWASARTARLS